MKFKDLKKYFEGKSVIIKIIKDSVNILTSLNPEYGYYFDNFDVTAINAAEYPLTSVDDKVVIEQGIYMEIILMPCPSD